MQTRGSAAGFGALAALVAVSTGCSRLVLDHAGIADYGLIDLTMAALYLLRRGRRC